MKATLRKLKFDTIKTPIARPFLAIQHWVPPKPFSASGSNHDCTHSNVVYHDAVAIIGRHDNIIQRLFGRQEVLSCITIRRDG
jgi:hypothetical protein